MASLDYEIERKSFIDYYDENRMLLEQVSNASQTLISQLTSEIGGIEVISRLKDREECLRKFNEKYRSNLESSKTQYEIKKYITDLIGVRIICLYEDEVSR